MTISFILVTFNLSGFNEMLSMRKERIKEWGTGNGEREVESRERGKTRLERKERIGRSSPLLLQVRC